MEKLKIIRNLKKELQNHFPEQECFFLAERLCDVGEIEITDEIIEKIEYLQHVCSDFSLDRCAWLIASLPMSELCLRYERYKAYCDGLKCEVAALEFTEEKFNQYLIYFRTLGLTEEQQKIAMSKLIIIGNIVKNIEEAHIAVNVLEKLDISIEERNQFITEYGNMLFNDYSRNILEHINTLIGCYGMENAYEELKKNPEILRLGLDESLEV